MSKRLSQRKATECFFIDLHNKFLRHVWYHAVCKAFNYIARYSVKNVPKLVAGIWISTKYSWVDFILVARPRGFDLRHPRYQWTGSSPEGKGRLTCSLFKGTRFCKIVCLVKNMFDCKTNKNKPTCKKW